MSARDDRPARSLFGAWRLLVALLCCAALVACKSPDGGGRGGAEDSQVKGTGGN